MRQVKFTPERINQIKNLVERGRKREEIAELIGVTVGSLQVTCSRLGISLRAPTINNGIARVTRSPSPPLAPSPVSPAAPTAAGVNFTVAMRYGDRERTTSLPLTQDMIEQLAFEAVFRGMKITDLIGELIAAGLELRAKRTAPAPSELCASRPIPTGAA
jgi:hypothetical protein